MAVLKVELWVSSTVDELVVLMENQLADDLVDWMDVKLVEQKVEQKVVERVCCLELI
jgi:hypothetical protein